MCKYLNKSFQIDFSISSSVTKRINDHNKQALAKPQTALDNSIDKVKQLQNAIDTANVEITNARRYVQTSDNRSNSIAFFLK
jgi:hypothetical protein